MDLQEVGSFEFSICVKYSGFSCLLFPVFSNLLFVGGRVADSEFGHGEGGVPRKIFKGFADVAEWSCVSEVSKYQLWSRVRFRALESLVFSAIKFLFSPFFFKNFNLYF